MNWIDIGIAVAVAIVSSWGAWLLLRNRFGVRGGTKPAPQVKPGVIQVSTPTSAKRNGLTLPKINISAFFRSVAKLVTGLLKLALLVIVVVIAWHGMHVFERWAAKPYAFPTHKATAESGNPAPNLSPSDKCPVPVDWTAFEAPAGETDDGSDVSPPKHVLGEDNCTIYLYYSPDGAVPVGNSPEGGSDDYISNDRLGGVDVWVKGTKAATMYYRLGDRTLPTS